MTEPIIQLRQYEMMDIDAVLAAVLESRRELESWMPWCHNQYCREDAVQWVESRSEAWEKQSELSFVIASLDGDFVGACGLNRFDIPNATANLGYWVRTTATGKGIATQAVLLLRQLAFNTTKLNRLEILTSVANVPSCRVAEKSGARLEATVRQRLKTRSGFHDAQMYAFLRADFCDGE